MLRIGASTSVRFHSPKFGGAFCRLYIPSRRAFDRGGVYRRQNGQLWSIATCSHCRRRNPLYRKRIGPQMGRGEDMSVAEFKTTEYGRSSRVNSSPEIQAKILEIGINKCARESGFHRANFVRKLVRGLPVKRSSYEEFVRWLRVNGDMTV